MILTNLMTCIRREMWHLAGAYAKVAGVEADLGSLRWSVPLLGWRGLATFDAVTFGGDATSFSIEVSPEIDPETGETKALIFWVNGGGGVPSRRLDLTIWNVMWRAFNEARVTNNQSLLLSAVCVRNTRPQALTDLDKRLLRHHELSIDPPSMG
jgi:hypothetical protein